MAMEDHVRNLREADREIQLLDHTAAVLAWDQETYMPGQAVNERAGQLALLQTLIHDRLTSDSVGSALEALGVGDENPLGDESLPDADRRFLRQMHRHYKRSVRLPRELVREFAETTSKAHSVWLRARKEDDFSRFSPSLKRVVELNRQMADHIGYDDHPYDALMDAFEPFMKTETVREVFSNLQGRLVELVGELNGTGQLDDAFLHRSYDISRQRAFGEEVLKSMHYDFERGRLDLAAHPFTERLGADDVRITTRFNERYLPSGLFANIHEGGHALYELGVGEELKGTVLGTGTSLGIHESQSRMWENMIGRSREFWSHFYPRLKEVFPEQLGDVSLEAFHRGINKVEPSLIRVEADEVTYGLHIILRFKLETRLLEGKLDVDDVPEAWREESRQLLGIVPETDAEGALQDVHWSHGALGYFPTYALGNLYAAQFLDAMERAVPDLWEAVRRGELAVPLEWLRTNIHEPAAGKTPEELCRDVTGSALSSDYFIDYLNRKFRPIYGLS